MLCVLELKQYIFILKTGFNTIIKVYCYNKEKFNNLNLILDYLLRHMRQSYGSKVSGGQESGALMPGGFSWRNGMTRHTSGIQEINIISKSINKAS